MTDTDALHAALNAALEADHAKRAAIPALRERWFNDPHFHAVVSVLKRMIRQGETDDDTILLTAQAIERILDQR